MFITAQLRRGLIGLFAGLWLVTELAANLFAQAAQSPSQTPEPLFHDGHFHLTNYVQEGISTRRMLELMGDKVGRVALFGIPLMQKWDYFLNGNRRPGYYLESTSEMYYYSFVDAMIARQYLRLSEADRERFDPFIVGFNPTDMNAKDHVRRVLLTFPGVFVGIGEFSIQKEFVTPKIAGHAASVKNPAINELLSFAEEVGLLVILHCDINEMRGVGDRPAHIDDLCDIFSKHPKVNIIYAHTGLGRFVGPTKTHVAILAEMCENPALDHVCFDIAWDEVAKWIVQDESTIQAWSQLINRHPSRFLFGTDAVAPKSQDAYLKCYEDYQPLWKALTPAASHSVRLANYERLVNAARKRVRAWEAENVEDEDDGPIEIPIPARVPARRAADLPLPAAPAPEVPLALPSRR
jgi:hypothetical protein